MEQNDLPTAERQTQPVETYTHGYSPQHMQGLALRTASDKAGFLLPHLHTGMALLDCGCGPGSITRGLAEVVAPGKVTGIDINQSMIEEARNLARQDHIINVQFQVANIYKLPFNDASFDAVFAHTVLQHLRDPLKALKEIYRVLKPGGVVGIRDGDWGIRSISPSSPLLEQVQPLASRIMEYNGGSPFYARHQRLLLRQAGFGRIEGFAFPDYWQGEEIRNIATGLAIRWRDPALQKIIFEQGWLDAASLEAMIDELLTWVKDPDVCVAGIAFAALGWKDKVSGSV